MKNIKKAIVLFLLVAAFTSCSQTSDTKKEATPAAAIPQPAAMKPADKFAGLSFANTRDYICGMPVTAGVEDTVTYKEKLYGFCSKECKDEFAKNPQQYLAAAK